MQPTLLIGDELLATKYPYGYSTASLPASIVLPRTSRLFGALPERGDVVVFRWPGDASQVRVKRVIGLPGDHIALRSGRCRSTAIRSGFAPTASARPRPKAARQMPAARFIETLPGSRSTPFCGCAQPGHDDDMSEVVVPPNHLFVHGRQPRQLRRQPLRGADGGVGMLPVDKSDRPRRPRWFGSWDLGLKSQPIMDLAERLAAVAVLHRNSLIVGRATAPRPTRSTACAAAA